MKGLSLHLLGPERFADEQSGARLFATIERHAPSLMPARFGTSHPFQAVQRTDGSELFTHRAWGTKSVYWRGRDGRSRGTVFPRRFEWELLSDVSIDSIRVPGDPEPLVELLIALASGFDATYAALHLLSPADKQRGYAGGYVHAEDLERESDYLSLLGIQFEKFVPDLFWCTILGAPYVELFGRERFASVEAHDARFLRDDLFLLRFSEDPRWVVEDAQEFEAARSRVKTALGEDAFFSEARGVDGEYAVPDLGAKPKRETPSYPQHDVSPGQELIDSDGDVWVVEDVFGEHANLRRVKDDLPFGVGSLSKMIAVGAFTPGADPNAAAVEKAKARHGRRHRSSARERDA